MADSKRPIARGSEDFLVGEAFELASHGETCVLVNRRMFLDRLGYLEETFFTFSFSPIRDESGWGRFD